MASFRAACSAAFVLAVICATVGSSEASQARTQAGRSLLRSAPAPSSAPPRPSAYASAPSPYAGQPRVSGRAPGPSAYSALPSAYGSASRTGFTPSSATCGRQYFTSYIDNSGSTAPDGSYKEQCAAISYNSRTDTLSAECVSRVRADSSPFYVSTNLYGACACKGNIVSDNGDLQCVPTKDLVPSAEGPAVTAVYESKVDGSGSEAPDGNYKESCRDISYNCKTDTIYARCSNGRNVVDKYVPTVYEGAKACRANLGNDHGTIFCRVV